MGCLHPRAAGSALIVCVCGAAVAKVPAFDDVSSTALPAGATAGRSMDAEWADLNADGRPDLVIASEVGANVVLVNQGDGTFSHDPEALPGGHRHDSEDIAIADFDLDGDPDIVFVSEDTYVNELYLNNGDATFADATDGLSASGISNAVLAFDADGDGDPDLLIGNKGQNRLLLNDGNASFDDATATRLPMLDDITQDLELGDVDGDGDLDLVVANEDRNRLLLNDGTGVFTDETDQRLPESYRQETREIDLADMDADGDLDVICANVGWVLGANPLDLMMMNDGAGSFQDERPEHMPTDATFTLDVDALDLDGDGDLDLVSAHVGAQGPRVRVAINAGGGDCSRMHIDEALALMGVQAIDVEVADFDGDGVLDVYVCNHAGPDRLLRGKAD